MQAQPLLLNGLNFKSIRMKSPQCIDKNFKTYELYYLQHKNKRKKQMPIIIQTPRLYLPFGLSKAYQSDDRYTMNLTFQGEDSKTKDFKKQISELDSYFSKGFCNYNYYTSLRGNDDKFYPPYLRAKISTAVPLQVYDIYGEIQDTNYIVPGSWATSLLYLKQIWVNEQDHMVGLSWFVLQTKIKTPVPMLNRCLIDDDWSNETLCSICHEKVVKKQCVQAVSEKPIPPGYEKYFKMLKLGIPMLAVIQGCQMDDMDPEVITNHHGPPPPPPPVCGLPPPPPPPPPNITSKSSGPPRLLFSAEDLKNSKSLLGKKQPKVKKVKVLNLKKRDPRVPSLDMILRSRNNLKKVQNQKIINNFIVPDKAK